MKDVVSPCHGTQPLHAPIGIIYQYNHPPSSMYLEVFNLTQRYALIFSSGKMLVMERFRIVMVWCGPKGPGLASGIDSEY